MLTVTQLGQTFKQVIFGASSLHQQCAVGLEDPQTEVSVWIKGPGICFDVTDRNVMAAAQPLTFGVGMEDEFDSAAIGRHGASMEFRERNDDGRLLGRITLRLSDESTLGGRRFCLFQATSSRNYCLPRRRIWAHHCYYAYKNWRSRRRRPSQAFEVPADTLRSVFVFYICPRPVVLVSVTDGNLTSIFPMDLIGPVGGQHFALALHNTSTAIPLIESARRVALSSVPLERSSTAYALGKNHNLPGVELGQLSFATSLSPAFGIPVPQFSVRVREMRIETVRPLGSHKLFLATTVEDNQWAEGPQLFLVHGIYQARREQLRGVIQ
jgi:flavin reductase (DIM6/NTAB) family NADH-FMN oxidoreductase RutF